jgi:chorismate mutase
MSDEMKYIRMTIDQLDMEIAELLGRRLRATNRIGEIKLEEGKDLLDKDREQKIIENVINQIDEVNLEEYLVKIYETILFESKRHQKKQGGR